MADPEDPPVDGIDIPDGTPVYGKSDFEVGIDHNGNGYIEVTPRDGAPFRFSVPSEEVEQFAAKRAEDRPPGPQRPPDLIPDDEVSPPDGWSGGDIEHTGGNIWNRIFRQNRGESGHIEVAYNPRYIEGVSAGAYGPEGEWLGEIKHISLGDQPMEVEALRAAENLMAAIHGGESDDVIRELFSN